MGDAKYPLPALPTRPLKRIAELLAMAWKDLQQTQTELIKILDEPEINALMDARINHICSQQPEWSVITSGAVRGKESISFDGSRLEVRPDISILLNGFGRCALFPLTVECKLINRESKKGIDLYCVKGLSRYVDGVYSWYAHEAFMLAYVRDGSTIAGHLTPYLIASQSKSSDPFLTEQLPEAIRFSLCELSSSRHGRRCRKNEIPSITVWHLWVS